MDGWNTFSFPFRMAYFKVRSVSFRECSPCELYKGCLSRFPAVEQPECPQNCCNSLRSTGASTVELITEKLLAPNFFVQRVVRVGLAGTPWKINMELENDGLEDNFPFQLGDF